MLLVYQPEHKVQNTARRLRRAKPAGKEAVVPVGIFVHCLHHPRPRSGDRVPMYECGVPYLGPAVQRK